MVLLGLNIMLAVSCLSVVLKTFEIKVNKIFPNLFLYPQGSIYAIQLRSKYRIWFHLSKMFLFRPPQYITPKDATIQTGLFS